MLLALLLIPLVSASLEIGIVTPNPGVRESLMLKQQQSGEWQMVRGSNGLWPKDLGLGTYAIKKSDASAAQAAVAALAKDIATTEALVPAQSRDAVFGATEAPVSHEPYALFNGRRYDVDSPYYPKVVKLVQIFAKLPMQFKDGIKLDESAETITDWKDGKAGAPTKFDTIGNCSGTKGNRRCAVKEWGVIYLE